MLGVSDGNATSGANYLPMYCALEAQHSIVRMIKRLTFSSSGMDLLIIRAVLLQEPRKMSRQVAAGISVLLKKAIEVSYRFYSGLYYFLFNVRCGPV
jgi:hypothetical protein